MYKLQPAQWSSLQGVANVNDLSDRVEELTALFGLQMFSFLFINTGKRRLLADSRLVLTNYPLKWRERYIQKDYHLRDPVVEQAASQTQAIHWGHPDYARGFSSKQLEFLNESSDFGVVSGYSFPIYGPFGECGLFSVACDNRSTCVDKLPQMELQMIGQLLHSNLSAKLLGLSIPQEVKLSKHERICLEFTLQGKTANEIALTLHRSKATIDFHLQSAIRKLNSRNKVHAAFSAQQAGLLWDQGELYDV